MAPSDVSPLLTGVKLVPSEDYYVGEKEPESKVPIDVAHEDVNDKKMTTTKGAEAFSESEAGYDHDLESTREWSTGICSCIPGYNSEHARSDCEICCLGWFAPCVLYGSNMVRLSGNQSEFCNNCCCYASLLILGGVFLRCNVLAPIKSWPSRSAIRTRFGLQSGAESVTRDPSGGCDRCCDCFLHFICHRCALCQEAREIRRRLPLSGPDSSSGSAVVVAPPSMQAMSH
ncbi:unnamed protein product [Closterium sp. Yama58-4]|nr:unnamed protein product [Closterium sp. Yama58-4]